MSTKAILLALVAALQFADIATTNVALHLAGKYEGNPIMAYAQHSLGSAWFIPKLLLIVVALVFLRRIPSSRPVAWAVAAYMLVVANNAATIWLQ